MLFPERILKIILANNRNTFELTEEVKPSIIRTGKRESLDSEDYQVIEEICFPMAEKLGLI